MNENEMTNEERSACWSAWLKYKKLMTLRGQRKMELEDKVRAYVKEVTAEAPMLFPKEIQNEIYTFIMDKEKGRGSRI